MATPPTLFNSIATMIHFWERISKGGLRAHFRGISQRCLQTVRKLSLGPPVREAPRAQLLLQLGLAPKPAMLVCRELLCNAPGACLICNLDFSHLP